MLATFSVGALLAQQLISPVAIEDSIAMTLDALLLTAPSHGSFAQHACQPAEYKVVLPWRRHEMGLQKILGGHNPLSSMSSPCL